MFNLARDSVRSRIKQGVFMPLLVCAGLYSHKAEPAAAAWFPNPPAVHHYTWTDQPCSACQPLAPRPEWAGMAALAGIPRVQFLSTTDETNGPAYSAPPNEVVLTPSALKLKACQLEFVIGHEIVHLAERHFDEDAAALSVLSGRPESWTDRGEDAMQLADGDFALVLNLSPAWQDEENDADWMGALLAAQACGCSIESGALAYFRHEREAGGGIAAAHAPSAERIGQLVHFSESAKRLVPMAPRRCMK